MVERTALLTAGERAWLERLILPLPRGVTILDLGCGGGEPIDRFFIDRGFRIVGVDSRATLIDLARTRFPRERWLLGDMREVALDEKFAAIIAWNSLHQLSRIDQALMAERAAAWLLTGGRMLFNVMPTESADTEGFRGDSRFREDLNAADYSAALARRGLIEIAHVENDRSCDGAGVWLIRKP